MLNETVNPGTVPLVAPQTVRKIRYGVMVAHIAVLVIPMAIMTVIGWFNLPKEQVITVALYDPSLDNVVENPSPDPDPDNPVPPSGEPDASETELPPPETPAPQPELPAPEVPTPQPRVNTTLPAVWTPPVQQTMNKPKKPKPKNKPKPVKNNSAKPSTLDPNIKPVQTGSSGRRGSNTEAGHNAPGGQRGNSGYDAVVASMIKRMWVTPDITRLGGREPRVLIKLTIDAGGRVIHKEIVAKSGVLAMDESVSALLANLRTTIKPYDGETHELSFYLRANDE